MSVFILFVVPVLCETGRELPRERLPITQRISRLPITILFRLPSDLIRIVFLSILRNSSRDLQGLVRLFLTRTVSFIMVNKYARNMFRRVTFLRAVMVNFTLRVDVTLTGISAACRGLGLRSQHVNCLDLLRLLLHFHLLRLPL